jgi:hypothetical protein
LCGQFTRFADDTRKKLGNARQAAMKTSLDIKSLFAGVAVDGYQLASEDVPAIERDDAEHGITSRTSERLTASADLPEIRLVATTYRSEGELFKDELRQGSDALANSLGVLDAEGSYDRGFRYLASYSTFIQPADVGPFWDAIWLAAKNSLVLVSVGPFNNRETKSIALDVSNQLVSLASQ